MCVRIVLIQYICALLSPVIHLIGRSDISIPNFVWMVYFNDSVKGIVN